MKYTLAGLFIFLGYVLNAQSISLSPAQTNEDTIPLREKQSPWGMSFQAGASVGSFGGHTFSASYLAPAVNYHINDRTFVFGGLSVTSLFLPATMLPTGDTQSHLNFGSAKGVGTFAGLAYQLNPQLTLYGAVHGSSFSFTQGTGHNWGKIQPGYTVGFEYKPSENFSFGVEVSRVSGGYSPIYSPVAFPGSPGSRRMSALPFGY